VKVGLAAGGFWCTRSLAIPGVNLNHVSSNSAKIGQFAQCIARPTSTLTSVCQQMSKKLEPYADRSALIRFDEIIKLALDAYHRTLRRVHVVDSTDARVMVGVVAPQLYSLALSIRELVRLGYLFGAQVLMRPLMERSCILLYLRIRPQEISKWNSGWQQGVAPSLGQMLDAINSSTSAQDIMKGSAMIAPLNSLIHGKPDSAPWTLSQVEGERSYMAGPMLKRPDLCDQVCVEAMAWLGMAMVTIPLYFQDDPTLRQ
jgi:hypothetical protein